MNINPRLPQKWMYPAVAAFTAGVLVAGLCFRLSTHTPTVTEAGAGSGLSSSGLGSGGRSGNGSPSALGGGGATPGITALGGGRGPAAGPGAASASGGVPGQGANGSPGAALGGTAAGAGTAAAGSGAGGGAVANQPLAGNGGSGGASPGGAGLTATDVGVTATSIRIGVALLSLGETSSFAAVPGHDPKQEQQYFQAYINHINATGGIDGRKIVPYYQTVDVTNGSSAQAACTTFTETDHVFAVLAGPAMAAAGDNCVAIQHSTVEISSSSFSSVETYRQARGLLISDTANGTRLLADWARALQHLGKLAGHKLGLVIDQGQAQTEANEGLVPALAAMGYHLTYTAVVSNDPSQGPAETAPQVAQMRSAGVDTVLDATTFVNMTAFVNQADKQLWHPQYLLSSYDGDDVGTFYAGMPSSFDGAVAVSYYGFYYGPGHAEDPVQQACRTQYNQLTGSNVSPTDPSLSSLNTACTELGLVVTAGRVDGTDLTRARFTAAVQGLGTSFRFTGLGGSFAPGKTDYDDNVRAMVWGTPNGTDDGGNCTPSNSRCFNDDGPAFDPEA